MTREKFNTAELLEAVAYLRHNFYHHEPIVKSRKSPIHVLVYDEIIKHSKEDIDASQDRTREGYSLYSISLAIKNPYIFSAFLKTGAFQNKLSPESKWLLDLKKRPGDDIYQMVCYVEDAIGHKNMMSNRDIELGKNILFHCLIVNSLGDFYKLDTPEKLEVIDKYIEDFGKKYKDEFFYFISQNYDQESKKEEFCEYLVTKMKNLGIDFSENKLLNKFLPEEDYYKKEPSKFFISSSYIKKINNLFNCGYKLDEKNYSYYGDNLFIAILKSERRDIIETFIPHLTDLTPKTGILAEQDKFVEDWVSKVKPDLAQLVKRSYERLSLEASLDKSNNETKPKVKI